MLFLDVAPSEKIAAIAAEGFRHVEFWGWRNKDVSSLKAACDGHNVQVANFSGHRSGDLIASQTHDLLINDLKDGINTAGILGCPTLMLLSNELGDEGQVVNIYSEMSYAEKRSNLIEGLEKALEIVPKEISLVIEPLNTRLDHPDYFLVDTDTAVSIIKEINHPRLKILCDLYHMGMMGEDLDLIIDEQIDHIGYFHIADFPGRHEPGTGTTDWHSLLMKIARSGYSGSVGFEYSPEQDATTSLRSIMSLWERAMQ